MPTCTIKTCKSDTRKHTKTTGIIFHDFSGSQSSSQAAAFGGPGGSISGAASSSSALAGGFGGQTGSQSASSAFGFNSPHSPGGFHHPSSNFHDAVLDVRHRGVPNFPFPSFIGRGKGVGAAAFRTGKGPSLRSGGDDFIAVVVSD